MLSQSRQIKIYSILILLFAFPINSSAQIDTAWISKGLFPEANITSATVVKADQSNNIIVAGTLYDIDLPYENIFIIKYDPNGDILWFQTFGSVDTMSFEPNTLCLDSDGNAYITFMRHSISTTTNYWSIAVQKYNGSDGTLLWTSELPDAQLNGFEWQVKPKHMAIDNNNLYVAGTKFEPSVTGSEMLIIKMGFDGNIMWTETHSGSGIYANSKAVAVDASGNVYIAGDAWNASIDYCVVKFDQNGNLLWDAFYDGQVYNETDIAQSIKVDNTGNVYITGYNQISSNLKDIVTVKYDQNGNFQWDKSYGNPEYRDNNAYFLENDASGNLYVGGYSAYEDPYPGTGKDYVLLKYDPSGNLLWDVRFDHFNYLNDHPFDFAKGPDDNIYICGISVKSCYSNEFITVVKYNPQGELAWNFCIQEMYGIPWGIDVIDNDEFVVAGASLDSNLVKDATTIKYISGTSTNYESDILNVFFESQIGPPIIDYENHTVTAFVDETANLLYMVPYIAISDYACMYPDDEDTTSFVVPVWYNVTSFDNVEQWWIVYVEGGYVGKKDNNELEFQLYPNPTNGKFRILSSEFSVDSSRIELIDLFGKRVVILFEEISNSDYLEINVGHLQAGIYLVRINSGNQIFTQKIIIQK